MNDLVTIIVPVFNVHEYLDECINSILRQTYTNIEVLLVDDGSTDGSSEICDTYKKYNSFTIIHKKNGGLSDARNVGIENAHGKYVCFVDSDDIIDNHFVEILHEDMQRYDVKISSTGMIRFYDSGNTEDICFSNVKKQYNSIDGQKYLMIDGYFNVSACNKMFDISLFDDIKFPIGKQSEDWYIMFQLIEKAEGLYYDSAPLYRYRQRVGSITKKKAINYDSVNAAKYVLGYYEKNEKYTSLIPFAVQSLMFAYIGVYNANLVRAKDSNKAAIIRKESLNYKEKITYDELNKKRKIQLFLYIHCPKIYNALIKKYLMNRN